VITEHFAVVAGEDHHRVPALPSSLQSVQETADVLVDELHHAVVVGFVSSLPLSRFRWLPLKEGGGQSFLIGEIALPEKRRGNLAGTKAS
jgi:hypothetical protein